MNKDDIGYLVALLKQKEKKIADLETYVKSLEDSLNHEMAVNDNLHDQNMDLKDALVAKREKNKVIPHPTSLRILQETSQRYGLRIEELTDTLMFAIELIPINRGNQGQIDRLKNIARKPF